jgi:CBS domain-containing protein
MDIEKFVSRSVLTVSPDDTLHAAAQSMMERGVGSAVITDGKPTGVLTDREALRAMAQDRDPHSYTVGKFLLGKLPTVVPSLELMEAARIMREKGFRHLVVVNEEGDLIGVFSMRDLIVGLLEDRHSLLAAATGASDPV